MMEGRFGRLELRKPQQSQADTRPMLDLEEHGADRCFLIATEARSWGDSERALRYYTRTLSEDRGRVAAWCGQVQMLVQLAEYEEAILWADKALEVFPYHGDLLACRAQASARLGDRKSAMACSDMSVGAPGQSAWRWESRGEVLLACRKSHYEECFAKAACEKDFDWFDYILISEILEFYGRFASAMKQAHLALSKSPDHAYNWYMLGRCQQGLGWLGAARESYQRSLELSPEFSLAMAALSSTGRVHVLTRLLSPLCFWRLR